MCAEPLAHLRILSFTFTLVKKTPKSGVHLRANKAKYCKKDPTRRKNKKGWRTFTLRSITAKTTRNLLVLLTERKVLTTSWFWHAIFFPWVTADYQDFIADFKAFSCLFAYSLAKWRARKFKSIKSSIMYDLNSKLESLQVFNIFDSDSVTNNLH